MAAGKNSRVSDDDNGGSLVIGRLHHVAIDCADPDGLARFYSTVLGLPITYSSEGWIVVAASDRTSGLAFQRAPGHRAPTWPDPAIPQQLHLDIMVDDVETAAVQVLALGARRLDGKNVFADPAGHPFCLIPRPGWAPPVNPGPAAQRAPGAPGPARA